MKRERAIFTERRRAEQKQEADEFMQQHWKINDPGKIVQDSGYLINKLALVLPFLLKSVSHVKGSQPTFCLAKPIVGAVFTRRQGRQGPPNSTILLRILILKPLHGYRDYFFVNCFKLIINQFPRELKIKTGAPDGYKTALKSVLYFKL
jgi:hypothetical protein